MKYYVIEIINGDDKVKGKGIYEYATLKEAVALFHKKLGTAMSSELYTSDTILVIDEKGVIYNSEHYVATVE